MELTKLSKLKTNPRNPRTITDAQFERLKDSLLVFPKMLTLRPLATDGNGIVLGGNMRLRALKDIAKMTAEQIAERLQGMKTYNQKSEAEQTALVEYWRNWLTRKDVPTTHESTLTDAEKDEFVMTDNASFGSWDFDAIANEWDAELVEEWGVDVWQDVMAEDEENDNNYSRKIEEDDFDPEEVHETKVKCGDIWILGKHRLMCGDSTDADAVAKLMNGERADLVFTDPPYGMKKESEGVLNDNLNFDDLLEFNKRWIPLTFANLKNNGSWYCWGIDEPLMDIYSNILKPMIRANQITFRNLITWFKNPSGCGDGQNNSTARSYGRITEKCLFVMCGTMTTTSDICKGFENGLSTWFEGFEKFRSYFDEQSKKAGLTRSDVKKLTNTYADHYFSKSQYAFPTKEHWDKIQAYCREKGIDAFTWDYNDMSAEYAKQRNGKEYAAILAKQAAKRKEWYDTRAYFDNTHDLMTEVWQFDRTSAEEREGLDHATPKPLALCARGIKTSSREGEIVLDVFGGSGSTMIACEQLGRKCRMMELDPHYCTVIIARWEKLTGEKARKAG